MTVRACSAALVPLLTVFAWAPSPAVAQEPGAQPLLQLAQRGQQRGGDDAQNAEQEQEGEGRRGRREGRGEGGGRERGAERGRGGAEERGGQDAERAQQRAPRQRQDDDARHRAAKQKQDEDRQRAAKQKQDDEARQRAARQKQDEDARQRAAKQKQDEDRQRAAKQKQDEDARQRAAKQKQDQDRQRAAKQKQDEDARQRAARQKQDEDGRRKQAEPTPKGGAPGLGRFDRRKADQEFERARQQARQPAPDTKAARPADTERFREGAVRRFEDVRKKRTERVEGSRNVIVEPDNRVIVRQKDRTIIRHDDNRRFKQVGREMRRERQKDGTWLIITAGLAGALIYTLQDDHGRLLRRSRRDKGGREVVLIDNRRYYYGDRRPSRTYDPYYDPYVSLPPPRVRIPREQYIVEYEQASVDDIYEALMAPPIEKLERGYSLDEVRYSYSLLERLRRVDLDAVNFDFGSWEVTPDQYPKLERVAEAMHRILDESPEEVFLLEGHTDAVGSDVDNLSLSDRRAESVAIVLTEEFEIPPENLMTQGYGKYHLKVETEAALRANRRVAVRRITPLLDREGWDEDISAIP